MTVQVVKTRAEGELSEQFAHVADRLPGGPAVRKARTEAIGRFAAFGLPHRRIEEWKYTDLRTLLKEAYRPRVDGHLKDGMAPSVVERIPPGAKANAIVFADGVLASAGVPIGGPQFELSSLGEALRKGRVELSGDLPEIVDAGARSVLALNAAFVTDGAVISIPDGAHLARPLELLFVNLGAEPRAVATRNVIRIGKGAHVTLFERHLGSSGARQHNALTEVEIGEGASVTHVKCLEVAAGSAHLGNWIVSVGAAATYRPFQLTTGSGLARNQLTIAFAGVGGTLDLGVAFLIDARAHVDTTLVVDHAVPGCTSRELVKGVLDGEARGIFQGKVIVRPDAQKTDGKQMAQALMLSPDAEFDSKPELEIHADDVVCGHGSTSAEIDEDLLFYCRARGIPLEEARAMLVESFIAEAIDKVVPEDVREELRSLARGWLEAARRTHTRG
jgi:Fe-S cluster assembly protein SufD